MNCTLIAQIAQRQHTANAFGSTFAFFSNATSQTKNAKGLPSHLTKTAVIIGRPTTTEKEHRRHNSGDSKGGVSYSKDISIATGIVVNRSLVFHPDIYRDKFCSKSPALRVAANR